MQLRRPTHQRGCVDHMPTGGSEKAADKTLCGLIKDNEQTAFQLSQKRSRCAGPLHLPEVRSLAPAGFPVPYRPSARTACLRCQPIVAQSSSRYAPLLPPPRPTVALRHRRQDLAPRAHADPSRHRHHRSDSVTRAHSSAGICPVTFLVRQCAKPQRAITTRARLPPALAERADESRRWRRSSSHGRGM